MSTIHVVTKTVYLPQGFKLEISDTPEDWRYRLCHGLKEGPWEPSKNPANLVLGKTTYLYYAEGTSYSKHLPEGKLFYCNELTE